MVRFLIYGILLIALFGNSLFGYGIVPKPFAVVTEILIVILLGVSFVQRVFAKRGYYSHLWYSFFFMVLIALCSAVVNSVYNLRPVFSLRLLFRFYLFYLAIINLDLHDLDMKRINMFVAILLVAQLPVVAIKYYYYGIGELTMGAYAVHEGSLTTMIPIVCLFYLSGYYFLHRARVEYLLLGVGFILFSIVGGKRAVAFLYPLTFLFIYHYIYVKGKGVSLSKRLATLVFILTVVVFVSASVLKFNPTLNPEGKVGGSVDVGYAVDYAKEYTSKEGPYGYTTGRFSTTRRVFKRLLASGIDTLFFGLGPGVLTPSVFDSAEEKKKNIGKTLRHFKIGYGITSTTYIAIEYGIFGVLIYSLIVLSFVRLCARYYKYEVDPYWKAFAAGSFGFAVSMMFFFFAYHSPAFWGDTMPALYFYAMAIVYSRSKRIGTKARDG